MNGVMLEEDSRALFHKLMDRLNAIDIASPSSSVGGLAEELKVLNARFEEERASAGLEAKRKMADLEELHNANRLVTVGMLTAGMAHEFGTPLGVVLARAQMIVTDENDLDEARKDAQEIILQVKRMTQMCREVLDYARPQAPTRVPIDMVQVARQTIALLLPEARKRNARLVLAGESFPCLVLGNASKLMQVFTNLIINAAQAMPKGGTVTLEVSRQRLQPPAGQGRDEKEYVCVQVRDAGIGIRSADLPYIFETFFTTKKEGEGTGLGLAVSYRIAHEHDGWIDVESGEGKGSTFTLCLPPIDPALVESFDLSALSPTF